MLKVLKTRGNWKLKKCKSVKPNGNWRPKKLKSVKLIAREMWKVLVVG